MFERFSNHHVSRRDFLQIGTTATIASSMKEQAFARTKMQSRYAAPALHNYSDYSWLRGFNAIPSWGARIEEAWWNYNPEKFREEIGLVRQVYANCIRLWIEFSAWMANPDKVTSFFMDAVSAIDEAGMKTMPCLFNRWHDRQWDYGGTYIDNLSGNYDTQFKYLEQLVKPLAGDSRILVWDLCNEPFASDLEDPPYKSVNLNG